MTVYFITSLQEVAVHHTGDRIALARYGITWDEMVEMSMQPLAADFSQSEAFSHPDEVEWDEYGNELVSWGIDNIHDGVVEMLTQQHREWGDAEDGIMEHASLIQHSITFGLIDNLKRMLMEYLPTRGLPSHIVFNRMVGMNAVIELTFGDSRNDSVGHTDHLHDSVGRLARSLRLRNP